MVRDIMKYIESEFIIINNTPCELCGGYYLTDDTKIGLKDGMAFNICECFCENCGHEKQFYFSAPFIIDRTLKDKKLRSKFN